jgi:hypothetical protein
MAVNPYQPADGSTRWFNILDLPPDVDGRRRQRKKRRFASERAVRDLYRTLQERGSRTGGPLSAATMRVVHP